MTATPLETLFNESTFCPRDGFYDSISLTTHPNSVRLSFLLLSYFLGSDFFEVSPYRTIWLHAVLLIGISQRVTKVIPILYFLIRNFEIF